MTHAHLPGSQNSLVHPTSQLQQTSEIYKYLHSLDPLPRCGPETAEVYLSPVREHLQPVEMNVEGCQHPELVVQSMAQFVVKEPV